MSDNNGGFSCTLGCWALAAGAGALTFVLRLVLGEAGLIEAIFQAGLVFVLLGLLFTWLFCRDLPKMGEAKPGESRGLRAEPPAQGGGASHGAAAAAAAGGAAAAAASTAASASSASADTSGDASAADAGDAAASEAAAPAAAADEAAGAATGSGGDDSAAAAEIKPSAKLAGEEELASRKGTWKYDGGASDGGATDAAAPAEAPAAPAEAPAASAASGEDYDKDGVVEGTDEGTRPEALDGPRGGKADNLKEIKGIGPKLEKLCNTLGFYHFDQIANWTDDEVAWVNANLEGFKGRVSRDEWVKQAKILAAGGETEFSKRVEDGDVY